MAEFNLRDYWVSKFQTNPELRESQQLITDEQLAIIRIAQLCRAGISDTDLYETARRWWSFSNRVHNPHTEPHALRATAWLGDLEFSNEPSMNDGDSRILGSCPIY